MPKPPARPRPAPLHPRKRCHSCSRSLARRSTYACQADDLKLRIHLVYLGFADWNCWNYRLFPVQLAAIHPQSLDRGAPTGQRVPNEEFVKAGQFQEELKAWQSHETRVGITIAVLAGICAADDAEFLGGCAYVLRRHDQKLATWTLEPQDGKHPVGARVLLAALLGGLVV